MTNARVEKVYADRMHAREFFSQAVQFRADADNKDLSAESQAVLLHNAAICACDAILQAVGLRVTPGDRSHVLRLETALDQFEDDTTELLERLDASRERRHVVSYAASFTPQASLAEAREATSELIDLADLMLKD
ncbi:MAG: hypothetical protein ACM3N0_06450 [Chloroflexota bacterium]